MKDYYQILHVRRGTSVPEIKRAYRMLVQQLHPDVNPDPAAHELIKEVNEAYDVLGDESKKRDYDYRFDNPYITVDAPQQPVHRDPRYRRSTTYSASSNTYTQQELMQIYLPYALWCCRIGLLLATLIFLDAFLPERQTTEEIAEIYNVRSARRNAYRYDVLVTQSGIEIKLYEHKVSYFLDKDRILINRTQILRIPVRVSGEGGIPSIEVGHIYRTTIFLPIVLFLTSGLGLFLRKKVDLSFSLCTVSGVLTVIIYFLIK